MIRSLPDYDPSLGHQTKQSSITDEQLQAGITPVKSTPIERVIQVLLFIFGLGWLRLILIVVSTVVYTVLMLPVVIFAAHPRIIDYFRVPGYLLSRIYIRCCAFCFGVFWIRRRGEVSKKARVSIFNHQSIIDGPLMFIYKPFCVIGMAELRKVPIFGAILLASDAVFVDRSKSDGQAAMMKELMEDESRMPLAMAPEGKTTKGHFLLDFRTGGFLSSKPIQPVTIRYHEVCAFAGTGHMWIVGGFFEFLWRTMCCPFCVVDLHYLPVLDDPEFLALPPKEKALKCQLMMANDLCVLASDRNSRDLLQAKKKTE